MTVQPIRLFGDPVLRTPAAEVVDFDKELATLVRDLWDTMESKSGAGLAAPQLGVGLRVFTFHCDGVAGHLVNPTWTARDEEYQEGEEGCLSIPGLYFPVKRAMRVRVTAVELDGTPVAFDTEEFLARILQHETDHVNGILFIDRLSTEDRKEAMRLIREQQLGLAGSGADPSRAL